MKKLWTKFKITLAVILVGIFIPQFAYAEGELTNPAEVELPEIYISAINPGYTVDGVSNVGEMIEIARGSSDTPISLAGITVSYTNSSGNTSVIVEFPEHSSMVGDKILLRLASSPESELAALRYTKTLAMKAALSIERNGEEIDKVCWTSKDDCYKEFKSSKPTTLVKNTETGLFDHLENYEPKYDEKSYLVEEVLEEESGDGSENKIDEKPEDKTSSEEETEIVKSLQCKGLQFSEILSYYETSKAEQFIEFYNPTAEQILLDGCKIRYKNKMYELTGIVKAEGYLVYLPAGFNLAKNPTNKGVLEIIDVNDEVVDKMEYPNGQRKATAYAWIGYDDAGKEIWRTTYAPTPGEANNYQRFRTCEEGKVINEATGNCVKVAKVEEKTCEAGYYLNPLTGRCKKYEMPKVITCKEGYYLSEETGRCRKIKENTGANYELAVEEYEEKSSFVGLYAVIGVVGVGVSYLVYEYRKEIKKLMGKIFRKRD